MICPNCKGKGYTFMVIGEDDVVKDVCDECDGKGWIDATI